MAPSIRLNLGPPAYTPRRLIPHRSPWETQRMLQDQHHPHRSVRELELVSIYQDSVDRWQHSFANPLADLPASRTVDAIAYLGPIDLLQDSTNLPESYREFYVHLTNHYLPFFLTHPQFTMAQYHVATGAYRLFIRRFEEQAPLMDPLLAPLFADLLDFVGQQDSTLQAYAQVRATELRHQYRQTTNLPTDRFSTHAFHDINNRALAGYDQDLFGRDPLDYRGFQLDNRERTLGRILQRLPPGATVADWGGGLGVFAAEIKHWRPDWTVYLNDLHTPTEFLASSEQHLSGHLDPRTADINLLIGDAATVEVPGGAHLLTAVELTPYMPDPLGLLTHQYNQLIPGGMLVTTMSPFMRDTQSEWTPDHRVLHEVYRDLAHLDIPFAHANDQRTLVLQRRDARPMVPRFDYFGAQPMPSLLRDAPSSFESFYVTEEPVGSENPRWLGLQGPHWDRPNARIHRRRIVHRG